MAFSRFFEVIRKFIRRLFSLIFAALFFYVAVELFSFIVFSIPAKRVFTFSIIHSEQKQILQGVKVKSSTVTTDKNLEIAHPYLGFVYNPEKNTISLSEHHGGLPISNHGFVDDKGPIFNKSDNKVIIGIFGGSLAYYLSVYGIESLINEIKRMPEFSNKEIIIVRAALGGYKQPQQLIALTYLLTLGAHFDIVINIDGFNDITLPIVENIPKGVSPFYPRNWFMLTDDLPNIPTKILIGETAYLRNRRKEWAGLFLTTPLRYGIFSNIIWKCYDTHLSKTITAKELHLIKAKIKNSRYITTGPSFTYNSNDDIYKNLAYVWKMSSIQMHRICSTNDIRYFHFLQPNQYLPHSKNLSTEELKQAYSSNSPYKTAVEEGYPYLIEAGEELIKEGVNFRDLTMIFRERNESLYSDNMCHLNKLGNVILGTIVGKAITQVQDEVSAE